MRNHRAIFAISNYPKINYTLTVQCKRVSYSFDDQSQWTRCSERKPVIIVTLTRQTGLSNKSKHGCS